MNMSQNIKISKYQNIKYCHYLQAEYFTVAVRTVNKEGVPHRSISLMVIEKSMKGVYTSRMKTQGWLTSTTTYVVFKNVKVPKTHIIGEPGLGFKPLMVCNI